MAVTVSAGEDAVSSNEVERYGRDLPRPLRRELQDTFAEALNARLKLEANWGLLDRANEHFIKAERRRRELVGDDQAMAQVTAQFMVTACAKTQRILESTFGGAF